MEVAHRNEEGKWLPGKSGNPSTQLNGSLKYYQKPEALQKVIDNYFIYISEEDKPPTITGLALYLGFTSRQALLVYQKEPGYEAFHSIVETAKLRIENVLEEKLISNRGNVIGLIFNMKNNFGWKDSQELTHKMPDKEVKGFNYIRPSDEADD